MNRFARIIFFVLALVVASAVSFVTYKQLADKPVALQPQNKVATKFIAVAAIDIPKSSKIIREQVRLAPFLAESIPPGSFDNIEDLLGRVALASIEPSEPVLQNKLASLDVTSGGMAALVKPNKRAMSIKVDQVIGVAGFLLPDHLVDVLVSIKKKDSDEEYITKTVLENIPVLSSGTMLEKTDKEKTKSVKVITLEVTPEEGEKLALATSLGKIQLALRGYTDTDVAITKGATVAKLLRSYSPEPEEPPVIAAVTPRPPEPEKPKTVIIRPPKPKFVMEVMNGNKVERITIHGR